MKKNLIVGSGISGATLASLLAERGEAVWVIDKKDQITIFIKSVKVYDYDASPLISVLQGIFSNYATKIGEERRNKLTEQISKESV